MPGTWVWALVQEDSTCLGAAKPCAITTEACGPGTCDAQEKPLQWEAHTPQLESSSYSPQLEKPASSNEDSAAKKKKKIVYA